MSLLFKGSAKNIDVLCKSRSVCKPFYSTRDSIKLFSVQVTYANFKNGWHDTFATGMQLKCSNVHIISFMFLKNLLLLIIISYFYLYALLYSFSCHTNFFPPVVHEAYSKSF